MSIDAYSTVEMSCWLFMDTWFWYRSWSSVHHSVSSDPLLQVACMLWAMRLVSLETADHSVILRIALRSGLLSREKGLSRGIHPFPVRECLTHGTLVLSCLTLFGEHADELMNYVSHSHRLLCGRRCACPVKHRLLSRRPSLMDLSVCLPSAWG